MCKKEGYIYTYTIFSEIVVVSDLALYVYLTFLNVEVGKNIDKQLT